MAANTKITRRETVGSSGKRSTTHAKGLLSKAGLGLKEGGEALLAVFISAMQVYGTPGSVFAIEQLLRTFQLVVIVLGIATVGAAPILDDIPVGTLATVTGGNGTLVTTGGVETANDIGTFFSKVFRQHAFVL